MGFVFQYGANMSSARLNAESMMNGYAAPMGLARTLEPFELEFSCKNRQFACATVSLRPCSQEDVPDLQRCRQIYGVLYDIPDDRMYGKGEGHLRTLDEIETEQGAYQRSEVRVVLMGHEDKPLTALTYLARDPEPFLKTELHYAVHLFAGLREFGAPQDYLKYVRFRIIRTNPKLAAALENL